VTEANTDTNRSEYDDEIDLVELIANLWREKVVIIISTALVTLIGLAYALMATPIYKVSALLLTPTDVELSYLNQTQYFSIKPGTVHKRFVETIESNSHISQLVKNSADLIEPALELKINENIFDALDKVREIEYPNIEKKSNPLIPDRYLFNYTGVSRQKLSELVLEDLSSAKTSTLENIHIQYQTVLGNKIAQMERQQKLALNNLNDQLKARKALVLSTRKDRLKRLEEALKIAKALNLTSPSSLSRLASASITRQVEINAELNNNQDPLYLRGSKLLTAEIENLRSLEASVFLDGEIRQLESQKLLLENNRELEQLKGFLSESLNATDVTLYSQNINAPTQPIKPKKGLIVIISILLGGMLGLFIAIGRIVYKNSQNRSA